MLLALVLMLSYTAEILKRQLLMLTARIKVKPHHMEIMRLYKSLVGLPVSFE